MSQATNINAVPSTVEFNDLLMKSSGAVEALKKENEEYSNPSAAKTRRGKKRELMPTNGKIIELQDFAAKKANAQTSANVLNPANNNQQDPNDNPVDGTSIYFRLAALYVNNLMQTNQLEMSAQAIALQANQKAMELVQQGESKLNENLSVKETADAAKTKNTEIAAGTIGSFFAVVGIACIIAGAILTLAGGAGIPLIVAGVALFAAGSAAGVALPSMAAANQNNPGSIPLVSSMLDNSVDDPGALAKNNALSSQLNSLSSTANNETAGSTQSLQNTNSLQQQYASMFSQMMNYYSSSMSAR